MLQNYVLHLRFWLLTCIPFVMIMAAMLPDKIAFVDLETTGARSPYDRVLEIGIVRVENNIVTKTFSSLIDPEIRIPPEIERLTGITGADIQGAPTFSAVKDEVLTILKDCVFVAHNVRFDYSFLKNELKREGIDFTSKHFCTVRVSQMLYPEHRRHNLDMIIERLSIPCVNRHRALDDAQVIATFYQHIQKQFSAETILDVVNRAMKKPSVPLHLQKGDLDALPENPGVYTFYGDNDIPLYIGKSVNIKDRVLSHFTADIHSSTEMKISQQIKRIETIQTAGELGALLLESKLIKEHLPLYNQRLRLKQQMVGLMKETDSDGYDRLSITNVQTITPADLAVFSKHEENPGKKILGFFRTSRQAKEYLTTIAKEHTLCEKLLGLEKTTTACFGYRIDRCKGACLTKETPLFYNIRLLEALTSISIKPWPFSGPIVIEEKNELMEKYEYFLIDKWCYLGNTDSMTKEFDTLAAIPKTFDLDMYKIIKRFIMNPANQRKIRQLPAIKNGFQSPDLGVMI